MNLEGVTPTEYLMMETLAARMRLGEKVWTFPSQCTPAAKRLADRGWVWWKSGIAPGTILAFFTDEGKAAWNMDKPYTVWAAE